MSVNLNNIETYINKVENPKGDILFLHGFTGNYNNKISFRSFFKEYNFYGINMPGHGNSKYEDIKQLNTDYFTDVIVEFINQNNLNDLIVLGHSMGGGLAINVYSKIPSKIKKLILEGPANKTVFKNYELSKKLIPNDLDETKFIMGKLFYNPVSFFGGETNFDKFCQKEYVSLTTKYIDLKNMLDFNLMNNFFNNIQNNMRNIKVPTLLVMGEYDQIVPCVETIDNFKANVSEEYLKVVVCKNAAHLPLSEDKQILSVVKEFVEG